MKAFFLPLLCYILIGIVALTFLYLGINLDKTIYTDPQYVVL